MRPCLRLLALAAVFALAACSDVDTAPTAAPTPIPSTPEAATPTATETPVPMEVPGLAAPPDYCPEPGPGLTEVETTPASPYLVNHPTVAEATTPTVVFLPGGRGSRRGADRVWTNYLTEGKGLETFRLVIPYAEDFDLIDDTRRVLGIVTEVLACYGGDQGRVHVAGLSNGGLIAFALMINRPEMFATLLGAPGAFPRNDPEAWGEVLADKRVFNGVGELDDGWQPDVIATHESLLGQGVDSVYVEFPGQGHVVDESFDESIFVEFWSAP